MTAAHHVPVTLPVLPGVALSGRYLLSEEPPSSRGDTLDAFALPGAKVALFVVDVVGSGPAAGVAATHAQAILRERLRAGAGLAGALQSLDRYAHDQPELCAATVCAATLGLDDGVLEWAAVGHPPPLLLGRGQPQYLPSTAGRPLGTGGPIGTRTTRLEQGEMIALYTDGLFAVDGRGLGEGMARLAGVADAALADAPTGSSAADHGDEVGDRMLRSMAATHGSDDDAAILLVAREGRPERFALLVSAVAENLPDVRRRINAWLDGLGAGLIDHVGLGHAVVELAANVVAHAYSDPRSSLDEVIQIDGRLDDDGTVCISVADHGRWRQESSSGRGLMMASGLSDTIDITRTDHGTRVEITQRLTRPVPILRAVMDESNGAHLLDETDELEIRADPGRVVASGPLDEIATDLLHAALAKATWAGTRDAVIDLDAVTHLASPSVQALFDFVARSDRTGTQLTLHAAPESPAAQILELVGLPASS